MSKDKTKTLFKSRILIKMPVGLTEWDKAATDLLVQVLYMENGEMIKPIITMVVDPIVEYCGKGTKQGITQEKYERVCYSIEP